MRRTIHGARGLISMRSRCTHSRSSMQPYLVGNGSPLGANAVFISLSFMECRSVCLLEFTSPRCWARIACNLGPRSWTCEKCRTARGVRSAPHAMREAVLAILESEITAHLCDNFKQQQVHLEPAPISTACIQISTSQQLSREMPLVVRTT